MRELDTEISTDPEQIHVVLKRLDELERLVPSN